MPNAQAQSHTRNIHVYGEFELEVEYHNKKLVLSFYEKKYGEPPVRKLFAKTTRSFKGLFERVRNEKGIYILLSANNRLFPLSRAGLFQILLELEKLVNAKL